ncbi:ribonuclease III [Nostoc sp. CHAB 5844]|nr:ribonuclease III [Nostoc sp. CHAB 5844]
MNDQSLTKWIQDEFGFIPNNLTEYRNAITLRKYQVLEFFGDSILGFVVAEYLVSNFRIIGKSGWFTKVKSNVVNDKNLSDIAKRINLKSIILIPSTSSIEQITDRVLADVIEALISAIYLDQGLDKCTQIVFKLLNLDKIDVFSDTTDDNIISMLQEYLARLGYAPPKYTEVDKTGSDHTPIYTIKATCNVRGKELTAYGDGSSKKEAKKKAANELFLLVDET